MDATSPSKHSVHCLPKKSDTHLRESSADRKTRNPYLNFLRHFRKQNCGLSAVEIVKKGAQAWNCLPKDKKLHFIEEAFYAPKPKKRRKNFSKAMSLAPSSKAMSLSKSRGRVKKPNRRMGSMPGTSSMSRAKRKVKKRTPRKRRGGVRW